MLIRQDTLGAIVEGRVTLQFRRWKRPTVKSGGTLMTSKGVLSIESVDRIEVDEIGEADARAAGFDDRMALLEMLGDGADAAPVYRIAVRYAGEDPRIALRAAIPTADEMISIVERLDRWDERSPVGPWTRATLRAIHEHPATLAATLAEVVVLDRDRFKRNVRKLKGLGLTESLEVGYRLSPRGRAVLGELARAE